MKLQLTLVCLFLLLTLTTATGRPTSKVTVPRRTYFQRLYNRKSTLHVVLAKASAAFPGVKDRYYQFEVNLEFKACKRIHYALAVKKPACKHSLTVGKLYVILLQDLFEATPVCPLVFDVAKLSPADRMFLRKKASCCGKFYCNKRKAVTPW